MISLRPFARSDAPTLAAKQYPTLGEAQILSMIDEWSTRQHGGNFFEMLAVTCGGEVVGSVSLYSRHEGIASFGVEIFAEYQRRGHAFDAVRLLLGHAQSLGYSVITSQVRKDNTASVALHAKLGFVPDHEYVNARGHEVYFYIKPL